MMNLHNMTSRIPEPVGKALARLPAGIKYGRSYGLNATQIPWLEGQVTEARREWILRRLKTAVTRAYTDHRFYQEHYAKHDFLPGDLASFDDIRAIPIVTKSDLRQFALEDRSKPRFGSTRSNTGGTSGSPLVFFLERTATAREWAHMHAGWSSVGYRPNQLKVTFRGSYKGARVVNYSAAQNEYLVNTYLPFLDIADALRELYGSRDIPYIHGYPSLIASFLTWAETDAPDLVRLMRAPTRAVLLGSEYPALPYRSTIDRTLGAQSLSWYGHSERAVLGFEIERGRYQPVQSYGYVEAVDGPMGQRLIGTAYDNWCSPFIRYDTGDLVQGHTTDGLLEDFCVTAGRTGDFMLDRGGQALSLTALIFGRHHRAFERVSHVQVYAPHSGEATLVVTVPLEFRPTDWREWFDLCDVNADFAFLPVSEPARTPAGKTPLLLDVHAWHEVQSRRI